MKTFLRNMGYISLGILISIAVTSFLPQTIKAVTAQLSTTTMLPMQDINTLMNEFPKSEKLKTTPLPYALPAINIHNNGNPSQMDMNGDGLLDMVYSYYNGNHGNQYVLLNTGSGFEMVYSCRKTTDYGPYSQIKGVYYQGDCADPNHPYTL